MSPRNVTLTLIDELKAIPNVQYIDYNSKLTPSGVYEGRCTWGPLEKRGILVPEFAWTDKELIVWLHEIGHMRTLAVDYLIYTDRQLWGVEVIAWKWVRATLGDAWTAEMAKAAARALNTYRTAIKQRRIRRRELLRQLEELIGGKS